MRIYLGELPAEGALFEGELPQTVLEPAAEDPVRCAGPVRYHIKAVVVSDEFLADGTLDADLSLYCSRCDASFGGTLESLDFQYNQLVEPGTEYVDLTADMREAIMLAFPSYPVCDPECKGLCPQCGVNRNERECGCRPPEDSRWSVLGGLEKGR